MESGNADGDIRASLVSYGKSSEEGVKAEYIFVREDISNDEVEKIERANKDLISATIESPFASFSGAMGEYWSLWENLEQMVQNGPPALVRPRIPELARRLSTVLSQFRAFTDHTGRALKHKFGDTSSEFSSFEAQTNREYDRFFEYRLSCNLRNELQHRQSIIGGRVHAGREVDGKNKRYLEVSVSEEVLSAALKSKKWQARVRNELPNIPRPIVIAEVLGQLELCCERIQAVVLIQNQRALESASSMLTDLAGEVQGKVPDGDPMLVFFRSGTFEVNQSSHSFSVLPIQYKLGREFEQSLQIGKELLSLVGDL